MALTAARGARVAAAILMVAGCARAPRHQPHFLPEVHSAIPLPRGFGAPLTPAENPLTVAKAELGRYLFYDRRLSLNQTQSCATCHQQKRAFTDGRAHAVGSTGEEHFRNTIGLANVGYRSPLTWADRNSRTLEEQVLVPLTNHDPVELAMDGHFDELVNRVRSEPRYGTLFKAAFPDEQDPVTLKNITRALASFERTLISGGSPYDRLVAYGDSTALSPEAWRGMRLFFSRELACSTCHGGRDFDAPSRDSRFQNTGLYDVDGKGGYPQRDRGLSDKTKDRADIGKFRVASLRNVAVTAPYMHDGSAATLSEAIDDYSAGGRASRHHRGKPAPGVDVRAFSITSEQKSDLIAFLQSLTDQPFLSDPRFSDPWPVMVVSR